MLHRFFLFSIHFTVHSYAFIKYYLRNVCTYVEIHWVTNQSTKITTQPGKDMREYLQDKITP